MRFLLRLYPRAWRERYGNEFEALLREERVGVSAVFDIIATGLWLRLLEPVDALRLARASVSSSLQGLLPMQKFVLAMAWLGALMGWAESHGGVVGVGLLASTAAVTLLKLLSTTASKADALKARTALMLILLPVLTVKLWDFGGRIQGLPGAPHEASLMGLILAASMREDPWPTQDRVKVLGAGLWACGLLALALGTAAFLGAVPLIPGILAGSFLVAFGCAQYGLRRSLIRAEPPRRMSAATWK